MNKEEIRTFAIEEYHRWVQAADRLGDTELAEELAQLAAQEEEVIDAFCASLRFGTSGIRGIIGAGTNRMNEYVVRRTTQGLSNYLNKSCDNPKVVIAYDTRRKSRIFAEETAKVLRGNHIEVWLFSQLATVSLLSYAIKELGCTMGIMITASHNPKIFNGYKVYNSDGYQIVGSVPDEILKEIDQLDYFDEIAGSDEGIQLVPRRVPESFTEKIISMCPAAAAEIKKSDLKLVYTPFNGTGNAYVRKVLQAIGQEDTVIVAAQESPDENFTTCPAPNPEKITAYSEGFRTLDQVGGDLIIATDPDCDRVGVCIYHDGMKVLLTGNQLGVLMLDYLCSVKPPKAGQFIVKSIVTTPLAEKIAEKHGLKVINTLTGFKYIGEIITKLEQEGSTEDYYFGFEESNGYLMDSFIRDKDGVSSAMLCACLAAYYKKQGLDLVDRLHQLYEEYGLCIDKTVNYFFEGPYGNLSMEQVMDYFRNETEDNIAGLQIKEKTDFLRETGLPKSNVIRFSFANGTQCIIRPSGTEAKIKVYYFETGQAAELEKYIKNTVESFKDR